MDFNLSPEQQELRRRVREYAARELAPAARDIDRHATFPSDLIRSMAENGLLGLPFPLEYGGSGMGALGYCIALEELAKVCGAAATINLAHVMSSFSIFLFGTQKQRMYYLPEMVKGKVLGSFGVTERGGGSDLASIQTEARLDGVEYVITGQKSYITNAGQADLYIILASTGRAKGSGGLSAFIIERNTGGLRLGKTEDLTGMRGISIGELTLEECRVPKKNIIGGEGDGLKVALSCIDRGRVAISAVGVGVAQAALDASIIYSKKRSQFGRSLSELQAIQFMIADMTTEIDAARLLTYRAACMVDAGSRFTKEASMAKLYSSEAAMRAALNAVQIHGGYGLSREGPVERYMRDAKALAIMEGTSEIQRLVIGRSEFR
ncbi:acyl-CoA dehydrogenase family protein [Candidatus Bathyarchaeota archaeon]|nr:acyl-CoA dehydrogenase family protein [Candidatus Bathyarchaeota archaeon]